jgi:hypothetical protein
VVSRLANGSNQWTHAHVVSQRKGYSNQNPVLFYDNQTNTLFLFHTQQDANKQLEEHGIDGEGTCSVPLSGLFSNMEVNDFNVQ